jgi:hypothetical protein
VLFLYGGVEVSDGTVKLLILHCSRRFREEGIVWALENNTCTLAYLSAISCLVWISCLLFIFLLLAAL